MKLNICFFIKDVRKYDFLKNKKSSSIKKGFDSEPAYSEKYLKTKSTTDRKNVANAFVYQ